MANRPAPEIEITTELVRGLLAQQFPELADLTLQELARGWDNTNLRLGDDLVVRVPHRLVADQLVVNEQRWLPTLAHQIDMAIPAPIHHGRPSGDYPWHWSVTPWAAGTEAARAELSDPASTARTLGEFFRQLHVSAPADAPPNPFRGCPLSDRTQSFETRLAKLDPRHDKESIARVFNAACAIPDSTDRVWLHGDLHTRNMVVDHGRLSAVIDWGDICAGDPATDLAGAFMLVPNHIDIVKRYAGSTEADWQRAQGWAINFAVIYLATSDDDEVMASIGDRLMHTLLPS